MSPFVPDIVACAAFPCQGTCVYAAHGHSCSCAEGWTGLLCETSQYYYTLEGGYQVTTTKNIDKTLVYLRQSNEPPCHRMGIASKCDNVVRKCTQMLDDIEKNYMSV